MIEPRESFRDNSDEQPLEKNKGLKLQPKKKSSKGTLQTDLNTAAKQYDEATADYLQRAFELGVSFVKILNNKTLQVEKGPVEKKTEQRCIADWTNFIDMRNGDHNQKEGAGSSGAHLLTLSCLLKLRDRVNIIDYERVQLEAENSQLKARLDSLDEKILEMSSAGTKSK